MKDAICTKEFMMGIKNKTHWCLNSSEVTKYRVCASKPSCEQLAIILSGKLANPRNVSGPVRDAMLNTALLVRKKPPSKDWQLFMMTYLCPDHEVFSKDYERPKHNEVEYI